MAGARPSSYRKGGGFLNDVDGTITDYQFTDVFPGSDTRPARAKKSDFNALHFMLSVRRDGATADMQTTLFAGGADDVEISDDGKTVTPLKDGWELGATTGLGLFMASLCAKGFPEDRLPEDEINFESIIGTRAHFVQEVDQVTTDKIGKRQGKNGKLYNRTNLLVSAVYDVPVGGISAKTGKMVKGATKPVGKSNGKVEEDLTELTNETLVAILADNDGSILTGRLAVQVAKKLGIKHPNREDVRRLMISEAFLKSEAGWSYDAESKTVSL